MRAVGVAAQPFSVSVPFAVFHLLPPPTSIISLSMHAPVAVSVCVHQVALLPSASLQGCWGGVRSATWSVSQAPAGFLGPLPHPIPACLHVGARRDPYDPAEPPVQCALQVSSRLQPDPLSQFPPTPCVSAS